MALRGPIISVEDDEDDQQLIALAVKALAIPNAIHFFHNGQEALDYLRITQEKPFLILCDINMPVLNGLELRRTINEDEFLKSKAIPFIFLTTAANRQSVQFAYDEAAQGYYKKADSFDGLKDQVQLIVSYWRNCLHPNSKLD